MRGHSGFTIGAICAALAVVGCDAQSIDLTGNREYMLANAPHDWLQGAGGGPPNPACEADPTEDASTATEECAVFASTSAAPDGDGTKARPYASLGEAIENANGTRGSRARAGRSRRA
ncbi:hypothetical protein [Sorangium sp. So ce362]|uniref:hypothetical protein n=1 Tax=Sorangium sp. So ce362 TaxID=3133303 RepID=UPI003F5D6846